MSETITKTYSTKELLKRFVPYLWKYKRILFMDLFCASLTTLCDLYYIKNC